MSSRSRPTVRHVAAFSLIFTYLVPMEWSAAKASAPPPTVVTDSARFAAALPAHATLGQVRAHLPDGTKIRSPHYEATESGFGNYVYSIGRIRGEFVFLPRGYTATHGRLTPPQSLAFSSSDETDMVTLTLNDHPDASRSSGEQTISQLSRVLGRPRSRTFEPNSEGDDEEAGWKATWRLSGGRTITYYQNLGGDYGTVLRLLYPYSANR